VCKVSKICTLAHYFIPVSLEMNVINLLTGPMFLDDDDDDDTLVPTQYIESIGKYERIFDEEDYFFLNSNYIQSINRIMMGDLDEIKSRYEGYVIGLLGYTFDGNPLCAPIRFFVGNHQTMHFYPLHFAAIFGQATIITYSFCNSSKWFVESSENYVDVDCRDSNHKTPLYYAYLFDHPHCVDLLLKKGAEEDAFDELKEETFLVRRPYLAFVEGVFVTDEAALLVNSTAPIDDFCSNPDWMRELMSYVGVADDVILCGDPLPID
jgi:hypothetical protein